MGKVWEQAVLLNPNYAYAHHGLGQLAGKQANFELAAEKHLRALGIMPGFAEAAYYASVALTQLGRLDEAHGVLTDYLKATSSDANAWLRLGQLELLRKDYEASAEALKQVLAISPEQIEATEALATCYMRMKDREKANKFHRKSLELRKSKREATKQERNSIDDLTRQKVKISQQLCADLHALSI